MNKPLYISEADYPMTIVYNVNRYELYNANGARYAAGSKQAIKATMRAACIDTSRVTNTVPQRWLNDTRA